MKYRKIFQRFMNKLELVSQKSTKIKNNNIWKDSLNQNKNDKNINQNKLQNKIR
jgi:hypothetical protein